MPKLFSVGHQLPQAEEAKDRDHDHNGSDDPDDVVHGRSPGWHAPRPPRHTGMVNAICKNVIIRAGETRGLAARPDPAALGQGDAPKVGTSLLKAVEVAVAAERQRRQRKLGRGHPLLSLALRLRIDELE